MINIPNDSNIFTLNKVLGPEFKEVFDDIFSSNLFDTIDKLEDFKKKNIDSNENNISIEKQELCKKIYDYSMMAIGIKPCTILIDFINNHKNLSKYSKSEVRYKRVLSDLNNIVLKTRFPLDPSATINLIPRIMKKYRYSRYTELEMDNTGLGFEYGAVVNVLLSRLSRTFKVDDYAGMWFVILFIKHLDDLLYLDRKNIPQEHNKILGLSIINLFLLLKKLEKETDIHEMINWFERELGIDKKDGK